MSETARTIETDDGYTGTVDEAGRLVVDLPGGAKLYRTDYRQAITDRAAKKHNANLAESLDGAYLARLADDLLREIEADERSRSAYLDTLARAIEMLGIRIEDAAGASNDSSAPLEGMSTFRHPLLLQSAIRFQADFVAEMLQTDGPVKVRNDETEAPSGTPIDNTQAQSEGLDDLAAVLQKDMNHYLTTTATEYYPDTTRMAFLLGLMGGGFKKVYNCPLRKRPVSESVDLNDLIVNHAATDLANAERVTHRISMSKSTMRRMKAAGVYRDIELGQPMRATGAVEQATETATGISRSAELPEDQPFTIYECATERDVEGSKADDWRPYKITLDKDSRQVLAIYRNWDKDDELLRMKLQEFVKFSYIDALGFYPLGLVHVLGNTVRALTATFREFLDAGMFSNFPGFLYSDDAGKQTTNTFRVAPGTGQGIKTGGKPIGEVVSPLPYKSPDQAFMAFIQHIEESGRSLGGEASVPLMEGAANMPVGTMLAQIEQTLKPIKGVFKGLHRAQATEFQLLKQRFREDPEAFWRFNKKPARQWQEAEFIQALDTVELVPMADPNTASQVQRIALAWALLEAAEKAPYLFKQRDTMIRFLRRLGEPEPEEVMKTEEQAEAAIAAMSQPKTGGGAAPPDPALTAAKTQLAQAQAGKAVAETQATTQGQAADLQEKQTERQFRAAEMLTEKQMRDADRQEHLQIATMRLDEAKTKVGADLVATGAEHHATAIQGAAARHHELHAGMIDNAHEQQQTAGQQAHEAQQAGADRQHEQQQTVADQEHQAGMAAAGQQHEAGMASDQQDHDAGIAGMQAIASQQQTETKAKATAARPKPRAKK